MTDIEHNYILCTLSTDSNAKTSMIDTLEFGKQIVGTYLDKCRAWALD